jgi:hypothetical protein
MIRFLFRFLGLLCLALGFVFLVYDGTKSIADQTIYLTRFEDVWNAVSAKTPQDVLRPFVQRLSVDWLWDPVVLPLLVAPVCLILVVAGAILILSFRKKKPLIGYAR